MIIGIFNIRTVNLSILSEAFAGKAKPESNYKRIVRFLKWVPMTVGFKIQIRTGRNSYVRS